MARRISIVDWVPADIAVKAQLPALQPNRVGLGITADGGAVSPMVIVVQAGLVVIHLPWEPGVVGEGGGDAGGVGVGLADAERVGIVPAPDHLVVGCPCYHPWGVQVVGEDVVGAGGGVGDRQRPDGIGGDFPGAGRGELDGDGAGRADVHQPQVSPGVAVAALVHCPDGGAAGVGAADGVGGIICHGGVCRDRPTGLDEVFAGAGQVQRPGEAVAAGGGDGGVGLVAAALGRGIGGHWPVGGGAGAAYAIVGGDGTGGAAAAHRLGQDRNRQVAQVHGLLQRPPIVVVFAQQVALFVVDVLGDGGGRDAGFLGALPQAVVGIGGGCAVALAGDALQAATGAVAVGVVGVLEQVAGGVVLPVEGRQSGLVEAVAEGIDVITGRAHAGAVAAGVVTVTLAGGAFGVAYQPPQLVDTVLKSIKQAKSQGRTVCQILR